MARSRTIEMAAKTQPRVLIVDDFPVARAGLRALLSDAVPLDVVGEAGDAATALDLARRLRPDLVLLEVAMLGGGGLDVLRLLRTDQPDTRVLVISLSQDADLVSEAIRSGAQGYLVKTADQDALVSAVRKVLADELAFDPVLLIHAMRDSSSAGPHTEEAMPEPLTAREIEVLGLVSHGHTNREIAGRLFVAVGTVKVHIEHILAKLGAADRTDAAVRAHELGLLEDQAARHMPSGDDDVAHRQTRADGPAPIIR
jgi:DNA-binding NarL/FixJ family response regulator